MELLDELDIIIWELEMKQRADLIHATNGYRDELKQVYEEWLQEFLAELEDVEDADRHEYVAATLLVLGRQLKEIQRLRLLEGFELGLAGDPTSPYALEELAKHIREQESYIDVSLLPGLEANFLDRLEELPEIGLEEFGESLLRRAVRVGLYAGAFWGAIQLAQQAISPPERECTWVAQDDEGTCRTCARYSGKVFTAATLPTLPGGDVECNGNCRCTLLWHEPLEIWP